MLDGTYKCMVDNPNTWQGAQINGGLANHPAGFQKQKARPGGGGHFGTGGLFVLKILPSGWPGHHVIGFPTMYLGSPPCIWVFTTMHFDR